MEEIAKLTNGTAMDKHNVSTTLNYWNDPGDGSHPTPIFIGKGRITNERAHNAHHFIVNDITGEEDQHSLDKTGFEYVRHQSCEEDFIDEQSIQLAYYDECKQLLKTVTGANRILIFNHKVRRGPTQWHHLGLYNLKNRGPVTKTHVDQSYFGAELRLRWELPDEADELVKKRYQIVNIWRPIATILKDPIAVADARTVADDDLVEADMTENDFPGKQWVVRHNPEHQWHYKYRMTRQDVLLIKCFDSKTSVARRALHSAFEDAAHRDEESRQSIEVRCLVLYDR
ncbi:hypothetical protein BDU57DRAFT_574865 [Ampelomyces quisqualis]|uniref:Methyltransferase-like protein n=1 Tax=Ampelomyces quisqualis TaxID=50730 RepID=A0A6A5QPA4_AMPQU|nr:hypothetical protein BDU57DRAFT_574865 [Ampelomyces quisqualis]